MISKHDASFSESPFPPERVCLWAAGVSPKIVTFLPTERHIFVTIGASILFTGILAGLSGYFSFSMVLGGADGNSPDLKYTSALAAIWALLIFNLDRSIVCNTSSWRSPDGGKLGKLSLFVMRVALAGVIAFVVSVPLELRLFHDKIEEAFKDAAPDRIANTRKDLQAKIDNGKNELENMELLQKNDLAEQLKISDKTRELQNQKAPKFDEAADVKDNEDKERVSKDKNDYVIKQQKAQESAKRNYDPVIATRTARMAQLDASIAERKKRFEDLTSHFNTLTASSTKTLEEARGQLTKRIQDRDLGIVAVRDELKKAKDKLSLLDKENGDAKPGLLQQIETLHKLGEDSFIIKSAKWSVRALIMLIEIIPVLLKLTSKAKYYDELVSGVSESNRDLCVSMVSLHKAATLKAFSSASDLRLHAMDSSKDELVSAAKEVISRQVRDWKGSEVPAARDVFHNIRLITDQLFRGHFSKFERDSKASFPGSGSSLLPGTEVPTAVFCAVVPGFIFTYVVKSGSDQYWIVGFLALLAGVLTYFDGARKKLAPNTDNNPVLRALVVLGTVALGVLCSYYASLWGAHQGQKLNLLKDRPAEVVEVYTWGTAIIASVVAMFVSISQKDEDHP